MIFSPLLFQLQLVCKQTGFDEIEVPQKFHSPVRQACFRNDDVINWTEIILHHTLLPNRIDQLCQADRWGVQQSFFGF